MEEITEVQRNAKIQQLREEAAADGRKLVTVRKIAAIDDIPGADLIKVATVDGWKVVVLANEFTVGDFCVFFEIDSFVLATDTRFEFLMKSKINWHGLEGARLKTIRLRKQLSQGLALPLDKFPELHQWVTPPVYDPISGNVGIMNYEDGESDQMSLSQMNFTGLIGVMKWERQLSADQQANAKGNRPSFIPKTDQTRCQNLVEEIFNNNTFIMNDKRVSKEPVSDNLPEETVRGMIEGGHVIMLDDKYHVIRGEVLPEPKYEVSLKCDGSSMSVYGRSGDEPTFGICSRNLELKIEGNEDAQFIAQGLPIINFLRNHPQYLDLAFQGELMGPGIQQNRENLKSKMFFIYNIYDIKEGRFLTPDERRDMIDDINILVHGDEDVFLHVPVLHEHTTLSELGVTNIDQLLKFADGKSMTHPIREGLVFKEVTGRHQFKVISNQYLEKEQ